MSEYDPDWWRDALRAYDEKAVAGWQKKYAGLPEAPSLEVARVAWLAAQPECIQKLAAEFPIGSTVTMKGRKRHVLGYGEDDMLLLSKVDPAKDYEGALRQVMHVCAKHFRRTSEAGA